jgi:hypothetical protein
MRGQRVKRVRRAGFALVAALLAAPVFAEDPAGPAAYVPVLSSYLQIRYTAPGGRDGTWAVRRLKAMIDGGPGRGLHYHVQFIYKTNLGSPTDDRVFLQDAYLVFPATAGVALKVGQFVPPFGLERFQPDSKLDFVDRTDVTNRMVVNGNLGKSFARDRGVEGDWSAGGWAFSAAVFQGGGANMRARGNGPLGAVRATYGRAARPGGRAWHWRTGVAASDRRDADLDLSSALTGLSPELTSHFAGRDHRVNAFVEGSKGRVRGQAEYFQAWLSPDGGGGIGARGAYGQVAYLPAPPVILALRYESFVPSLRAIPAPRLRQWAFAVTYDVRRLPLRVVADYLVSRRGSLPCTHTTRLQIQYVLLEGLHLRRARAGADGR